ncbi:hypothetical protein ACFQV8_14380 [Pseudonocardia benzenivorans]
MAQPAVERLRGLLRVARLDRLLALGDDGAGTRAQRELRVRAERREALAEQLRPLARAGLEVLEVGAGAVELGAQPGGAAGVGQLGAPGAQVDLERFERADALGGGVTDRRGAGMTGQCGARGRELTDEVVAVVGLRPLDAQLDDRLRLSDGRVGSGWVGVAFIRARPLVDAAGRRASVLISW